MPFSSLVWNFTTLTSSWTNNGQHWTMKHLLKKYQLMMIDQICEPTLLLGILISSYLNSELTSYFLCALFQDSWVSFDSWGKKYFIKIQVILLRTKKSKLISFIHDQSLFHSNNDERPMSDVLPTGGKYLRQNPFVTNMLKGKMLSILKIILILEDWDILLMKWLYPLLEIHELTLNRMSILPRPYMLPYPLPKPGVKSFCYLISSYVLIYVCVKTP
jgi:hypothetical protein